jgi:hypothetical protein
MSKRHSNLLKNNSGRKLADKDTIWENVVQVLNEYPSSAIAKAHPCTPAREGRSGNVWSGRLSWRWIALQRQAGLYRLIRIISFTNLLVGNNRRVLLKRTMLTKYLEVKTQKNAYPLFLLLIARYIDNVNTAEPTGERVIRFTSVVS